MSEIWLVLAVASAFFAVVLIGLAVESGSSRRSVLSVCSSRTSEVRLNPSTCASRRWQRTGQRVLIPIAAAAGRVARRVTPLDARDRVAKKLQLAGGPVGGRRARNGVQGDRRGRRCLRRVRALDDPVPAAAVHLDRRDLAARVRRLHPARLDVEPTSRGVRRSPEAVRHPRPAHDQRGGGACR